MHDDDVYEYSEPRTFGAAGGSGAVITFLVTSPWHSECDWQLVSLAANGVGTVALTSDGYQMLLPVGTATQDSWAPNSNGGAGVNGWYLNCKAAGVYMGTPSWVPMPATLYGTWATTTVNSITLTLIFRRRKPAITITLPLPDEAHDDGRRTH